MQPLIDILANFEAIVREIRSQCVQRPSSADVGKKMVYISQNIQLQVYESITSRESDWISQTKCTADSTGKIDLRYANTSKKEKKKEAFKKRRENRRKESKSLVQAHCTPVPVDLKFRSQASWLLPRFAAGDETFRSSCWFITVAPKCIGRINSTK
ncbi:hypothetical protein KIL84_022497 [Mauremys mutica]|uniref:Uncharacterized protein n=1 Tax=Mauremys mutica TaxID=74926 RepID=A0A9D4ANV5_9SAUR|nr:hypothetical protein KIL84_022497 [Mauremys mutica]